MPHVSLPSTIKEKKITNESKKNLIREIRKYSDGNEYTTSQIL
jgi:hypothetical protein